MKLTKQLSAIALLGAVGVLIGCSSEEQTPVDPSSGSGRAIRFAAQTDHTRAQEVTTNTLSAFHVYAYLDGQTDPYMDNVTVTKTGNNTWTYAPMAYWPSAGNLSFYAYAPGDWVGADGPLGTITWDNNTGVLPATTDLIYAVAPNLHGSNDSPNAQVIFNFRHALSKVTVKMSSTNPSLQVKVTNVVLVGLSSRANFRFPTGNTSEPLADDNVGTWSDQNTPVTILLHMSQTDQDRIILNSTPTNMGDTGLGLGGSKFIIPQLLNWRSSGFGRDTYIAVMCTVMDTETGKQLWPNENTPSENVVEGSTFGDGLLKFPFSTSSFSEFKPGYHYVYNLVINSNEEMGGIEFGAPTVDSYVDVTTSYE